MIHLMTANGKTLCGLLIKEAQSFTDSPKTCTCPECNRLVHKHVERVVKHYPPGAIAKSHAWKEVD